MSQALDKPGTNRVHDLNEHYRHGARRRVQNPPDGKTAGRHDDIRPERDHVHRVISNTIGINPAVPMGDPQVATDSPAECLQCAFEFGVASYRFRIILW
jgi:hypothetical protein